MTLSSMSPAQKGELAVVSRRHSPRRALTGEAQTLAALLLHDAKAEVSADKIKAVLAAAGVADVPAYLPSMYASLLAKEDVSKLILSSTAPGGGPSAAPAAAAAGGAAPAKAEAKKEEKPKKEEKKEEEVDVGGGDLFGSAKGGKCALCPLALARVEELTPGHRLNPTLLKREKRLSRYTHPPRPSRGDTHTRTEEVYDEPRASASRHFGSASGRILRISSKMASWMSCFFRWSSATSSFIVNTDGQSGSSSG